MTCFRFTPVAGLLSFGTLLLAATACAGSSPRTSVLEQFVSMLDSLGRDTIVAEGPRVAISTDDDIGRHNRVIARLHVDEDAYVAVVNVSPAGFAQVVYPELPGDVGFLRAGKTYVVPSYFTGYQWESVPPVGAIGTRFVWYGRSINARAGARGPGYMFVIASRAPLNMGALEAEGYFDGVDVGSSLTELEPQSVMPQVALLAIDDGASDVSVDFARYSGYDAAAYASSRFRSAYNTGYCDSGYGVFGPASISSFDAPYSRSGCNPLDMWRFRRHSLGVVVVPGLRVPPVPDSLLPPWKRQVRRPRSAPDTTVAPTSRGEVTSDLPVVRRRTREGAPEMRAREAREVRARPPERRTGGSGQPGTRSSKPLTRTPPPVEAREAPRSSPPPTASATRPATRPATRGEGAPRPVPAENGKP